MDMFKTLASIVTGTIGAYLMYRGKKTAEPKLMIIGGILVFASYLLFS